MDFAGVLGGKFKKGQFWGFKNGRYITKQPYPGVFGVFGGPSWGLENPVNPIGDDPDIYVEKLSPLSNLFRFTDIKIIRCIQKCKQKFGNSFLSSTIV